MQSTYLLNMKRAIDVAKYGKMMYNENACSIRVFESQVISIRLNVIIDAAIISDWPASSPLMPANILIALVQNTANIPI